MSKLDDISNFIIEAGLKLSAPVIQNPIEEDQFYAFVQKIMTGRNIEEPTKGALDKLQEKLSSIGISVAFVLTGGSYQDAEAGIRALMTITAPDLIESCFMSVEGKSATIWITPKRSPRRNEIEALNGKASAYVNDLGLEYDGIHFTPSENLPSKFACLNIIRLYAPIGLDEIVSRAKARGFDVPSTMWMSKNLDSLRKSGQVIRMKSGAYALTMHALKSLGTSKDASSPDITRLLDLARRRS